MDDCDQRCKHCYIFSGDESVELNRMSFKQMQQTLANIEDFCETFGRDPYLYITGGDPILHPDFWRLMDLLKRKGIIFTIMGNPFHLTDEVCSRLHESGCLRYQMSIDGNRETHDWFRKPGSYDETLARIPMLAREGIRSIIMTTVSDVNAGQLPEIIDAVVESQANVFAFSRYVPTLGENMEGLSAEEYRAVLDSSYKKFKAYEEAGCETYFNRKDHLWRLYEWEEGLWSILEGAEEGMIYDGCNCSSGHLTILPTGDVYACRRVADSKVGNVFEERLADIWLGSMEDYRQVEEFSKCSHCELYDEGSRSVSSAQPSIADDASLRDGFYGAPAVVHCFTPRGYSYAPFDASMAAANMMTAAWSLGVGSCFVSRAERLFEVEWARDFARANDIPDDYEGSFHLVLGYASDDSWSPKPQYPGRIHWC